MNEGIYVAGRWRSSASTETVEVLNPATEELLRRLPAGAGADVERAVEAAAAAFPAWSATPVADRCAYIAAISTELERRADEFAELIAVDVGCPLKIARRVQVGMSLAVAEAFRSPEIVPETEELGNSVVVREPVGVVAAITAWNFPLFLAVAKVLPALAAGCTVVLKPGEVAPLTAYLFAEVVDAAGVPPGVFNMVSGTGAVAGEALVAHPGVDMISFTGSTRAGIRVGEVAARTVKRVTAELGGKSPSILLPGADLASAVRATVRNAYLNSGQTCGALTRMLVHHADRDEAVEVAVATARAHVVGDPFDPATRLGPLASGAQRDRVRRHIDQGVAEGATLVCGGSGVPAGRDVGYYVDATVFADVTPEMAIAGQEIFGPVLSVMTYTSEEEAVRIANGTPYGLVAAVWAGDTDRAMAVAGRIRAGQVDLNGARFNPAAPFGGYKASGNGRELGRHGVAEFLETKSIQR
jgi:aldehyde dehydrogenase (NAD+)